MNEKELTWYLCIWVHSGQFPRIWAKSGSLILNNSLDIWLVVHLIFSFIASSEPPFCIDFEENNRFYKGFHPFRPISGPSQPARRPPRLPSRRGSDFGPEWWKTPGFIRVSVILGVILGPSDHWCPGLMESNDSIGIILFVHLISFSFALISLNFGPADSWN